MNQIFDFFLEPYRSAETIDIVLEIIAVIFGVLGVWYGKKENILVYPLGLINTTIFTYLCLKFSLYGDFFINIYYTLMSIYGWYMWTTLVTGKQIGITTSTKKDWLKTMVIFMLTALFIIGVYLYFNRFDRATDYFDTVTTGVAFAAMWLMANKKIEHWLLWIIVNIISIPLYYVKGLGFSMIQFIILLIIAIQGYKEWKKHLNNIPATALK
ncbi:nicotinamide riboside transporter PnuC [Winogradskyella bathintestinalis]|uniref:Nicotinamide riboside transporter PnuC n=1 Tax=Winogradskyella bathintestinalis TaxID=3035208 RepID=A0ABT7ZS59_9FLAO|nr:nicotinamide riboside transporter PnuC [Winogradskyella bathintestinalis]MDN3491847.1 nicotinamide riboside transporter PnuC [Winogradskyella bathintestinalis]